MIVLAGIVAGIWLLPGIYAFTSMLDSFNYDVPDYATWIGVILFGAGLVLRWLSHKTLAGMWSGTLEMSRDHHLVTNGIYRHMRHPIYSSLILWSVGQPLLLMNLIAGWSGLIAVALLWVVRVPREEAMMRARFGAEYERYAECTGRIFPRIHPVTK
jgi:protein-S-isoprenylcysteine O-methyltransferase Ste14